MAKPIGALLLIAAVISSCGPSQRQLEREDKEARAAEIVAQYENRDKAEEACEEKLDPGFFEGYCHDAASEHFGEETKPKERPGRFIKGLAAVDVTINLEQSFGFECDGPDFEKGRVRYYCRSSEDPASYVEVYGKGPTEIENVAAFSTSFASDLLSYVATLPYKGSRPTEAKEWVLAHLGDSEAHLTIGTARFNMFDGQLLEIDAIRSKFGTH